MVEQPMESAVDPELPVIDTQLLRQLIHQKLQELKHGDLFMDGLGEECFSTVLTNEKYYDVFTNILGTAWMDIHIATNTEKGLNGGKMKRKKKKFIKAVRQARDFVRPEIDYFMSLLKHTPRVVESKEPNGKGSHPDKNETETPPHEIEDNANSHEMDDVSSMNSHSTSRHSKASSKKKKKKSKKVKKKHRKEKRKYDKKGKERKKRGKSTHADEESDMESPIFRHDHLQDEEIPVQYTQAEAKEMFEKKKSEILSKVPKEVKDQFRSLAFCKWSKDFLPCLQLSPYDVSPGAVRDSWMEMFQNCLMSHRPLTRLIFWYGTTLDAMDSAYSFVQEKNLITYEEGCKKGFDRIPSKISKKLEKQAKLTKNEEQHLRGLTEIKDDSKKKAENRLDWLEEWQEDHELIKDNDDIEASDDIISKSSKEPTPPKKKRGRKRKSEIAEDEAISKKKNKSGTIQHALLEPKDESSKLKKKKKLKKITSEDLTNDNPAKLKKSKKIEHLGKEGPLNDLEDSDSDIPQKKKIGSPKKRKEGKYPQIDEKLEEDHEEIMNEEIPSDDDRDDDFSASAANSDEELDNDYNNTCNVIETKKNKPSPSKAKKPKKKYVDETEEEVLERRLKDFQRRERLRKKKCEKEGIPFVPKPYKPKGRKKKVVVTETNYIETEHAQPQASQSVDECERIFIPIMQGLEKSNKSIDESSAMNFLHEILNHVELITPSFVREKKIGMLIKDTRVGLGARYPEVEKKCREVTSNLKRVFAEKNKKSASREKKITSSKTKSIKASTIKTEVSDAYNSEVTSETAVELKPQIQTKIKKEELSSDIGETSLESIDNNNMISENPLKTPLKEDILLTSSIPKKEASKIEMEDTPKVEKTSKPAKKSFSLARMFEKPKKTPTSISKSTDRSINNRSLVKQLPSWLTDASLDVVKFPQNSERDLALNLLNEAVSFFPSARVNKEFVAKLMESTIFEWSNSLLKNQRGGTYSKSPMKAYWEKIDDTVAALAGNKSNGGIVLVKILDGEFPTVGDFIKLPRKTLHKYFLGKSVI